MPEYTLIKEISEEYRYSEEIKYLHIGGGERVYYIALDNKPYAVVETKSSYSSFDTAVIFGNYLCIGVMDTVYFVELHEVSLLKSIEIDFYFGYFNVYKDKLFIAGGINVTMLDKELKIIWKSEYIADDGILFSDINDNTIELLCIFDPPDGETRTVFLNMEDGTIKK